MQPIFHNCKTDKLELYLDQDSLLVSVITQPSHFLQYPHHLKCMSIIQYHCYIYFQVDTVARPHPVVQPLVFRGSSNPQMCLP